MDERVLITGGAGFIGLHLARALVARGAQVTLVDNFFRGVRDKELQALLTNVRLIEYDLTLPVQDHILGGNYTQVYHLAAVVGVRHTHEVPHHVLRTNLVTTLNVLDWCMRQTGIICCFTSTSEVYDGAVSLGHASIPAPEATPLTISEPRLPRSSYAASKITGELLCLNYARVAGFPVRIVRYHNVYGPRMGYEHVIPQFIQRVLERQNPFNIYGAQQSRAFCYVDDAVEATIQLMALPTADPLIVNVGNDQEEIRIVDLAHKLFAIADFHPSLAIHPPPPGSPERRCPDLDYLRRLIGHKPTVDLESGLCRTYAWYCQNWEHGSAVRA